MASSNVIIRKCEGQGINVQDLNGLAYFDTKQDVKCIIWQDNSKILFN